MNDHDERYLKAALDELYHGGASPDLADRILKQDSGATLKLVRESRTPRRWVWLQAASVLIALGLIAFVLYPRDSENPPIMGNVDDEWTALNPGSPDITLHGTAITDINGRVLVKPLPLPDSTELQAREEWLQLNGLENVMNRKWLIAGNLAVCVLFGSVTIDGQTLHAQDAKEEAPEVDLKEQVRKLEEELIELRKEPDKNVEVIKQKENDLKALRDKLNPSEEIEPDPNDPITVDFVRKDINTIMHYIALRSGLQIIVQGEIEDKFTVMYKDVDPKEAIKSICKEHGLEMVEDGQVTIIKKAPKRFDFVFNGSLGDALDQLKETADVDVRADRELQQEFEIVMALNQLTVRQVLELLCDDLELALVEIGTGYVIRKQLGDLSEEELSALIQDYRASSESLDMNIQFATIALEAAHETGDKEAIEKTQKHLDSMKKEKEGYDAEVLALEAELAKRD